MKKIKKFVALVAVFAMVLWSFNLLISGVFAATVTSASDTMTRHAQSTSADHTIEFDTSSGVAEGETITLNFESDFDLASIVEDDVDVADDAADLTTAADCTGAEEAGVSVAGQVLTIEICSGDGGAIAGGSTVEIEIGSHAAASGSGSNQILNTSTTGSKDITIGGTMSDSGIISVPIVDSDQVTVNAEVGTTMTFDLDAHETGATACDNSSDNSSPYTVDLGTLTSGSVNSSGDGTINSICVENITTTATGGAVVQIASANDGLDSTSTPADTIDNAGAGDLSSGTEGYGACVESSNQTSGTLNIDSDWDGSAGGGSGCDSTTHGVGDFLASNAFDTILDTNTSPISGGYGEVLVKAAISATTEAHDDYTDTLTFRATGTF